MKTDIVREIDRHDRHTDIRQTETDRKIDRRRLSTHPSTDSCTGMLSISKPFRFSSSSTV